jgi:hypothetical protein
MMRKIAGTTFKSRSHDRSDTQRSFSKTGIGDLTSSTPNSRFHSTHSSPSPMMRLDYSFSFAWMMIPGFSKKDERQDAGRQARE